MSNSMLYNLKDKLNNDKCLFWVGAGISKDSGAPLGEEWSNSIIYALCKNQKKLKEKIYGELSANYSTPPKGLIKPWTYALEDINPKNIGKTFNMRSKKSLRLETILEIVRECIPEKLSDIFMKFNILDPNPIHYLLVKAMINGHHIITTNFDCLFEKAAENLNLNIKVRIWDPKTNKIIEKGDGESSSGILLKLHGSIGEETEPETFIHQFIIGAPEEVTNLLQELLEDRLVIFLGYGFNDYFDLKGSLTKFSSDYNASAFVVNHCEKNKNHKEWVLLNQSEYPLSEIECNQKTGIKAHTRSFVEYIFDDHRHSVNKKNILPEIIKTLEEASEKKRLAALFWLLSIIWNRKGTGTGRGQANFSRLESIQGG